jgi:hypothetical protein
MPEAARSPDAAELADPTAPRSSVTGSSVTGSRATGRAIAGRGVTGRGVIALILVTTLLAGLIGVVVDGHRGRLFGVVFVVASAVGAVVVRRRDLPVAMVAPPLLYCVLIALMSLVDQAGLEGGFASREVFYIGNAFVTGAPTIWSGTALAVAIGWYRRRR